MLLKSLLLLSIIFAIGFGTQESFAEEFLSPVLGLDSAFTDPNTALVNVNPDLLSQDSMNITIFGQTTTVTHDRTIFRGDNDFTYIGSTPGSFENVYIAYLNGDMRLELTSPGNNYVLVPSGEYHSIIQFDELIFGPDQEEVGSANIDPAYEQTITEFNYTPAINEINTDLFIDIIYLYTPEAAANVSENGIILMGNLGIDKTNVALAYSDNTVRLRHVGTANVDANYVESGEMYTELHRLIDVNDGLMVNGHEMREATQADVGFLFIDNSRPGLCGRVNVILSVPETSYLAVDVDNCRSLPMGSTLAHEFGHLAGMHHDVTTNEYYANKIFAHGHGYSDHGEKLDTLLAYPCSSCDWQNVWSDPDNVFQGTNVTSGTYNREDNARVIQHTASYMSTFKGAEPFIPRDIIPPIIHMNGVYPPLIVNVTTYTELGANVTDNDPNYVGTVTIGGDIVDTSVVGEYHVTYNANPDPSGNIPSEVIRTVIVYDTGIPEITLPDDYTTEATAIFTPLDESDFGLATADDTIDGELFPTNNSPGIFPLGETLLVWNVTDSSGLDSFATQTITIIDTTPPVLSLPPDVTVSTIQNTTAVYLGYPTVTDIADPTPIITNNNMLEFPIGNSTVTWTAIDSSGNSASADQTVTVIHNESVITSDLIDKSITKLKSENAHLKNDIKSFLTTSTSLTKSIKSDIKTLRENSNAETLIIEKQIGKLKFEAKKYPINSSEKRLLNEKIQKLVRVSDQIKFDLHTPVYSLKSNLDNNLLQSKHHSLDNAFVSKSINDSISELRIQNMDISPRHTVEQKDVFNQIEALGSEKRILTTQHKFSNFINNELIYSLERDIAEISRQLVLDNKPISDEINELKIKLTRTSDWADILLLQVHIDTLSQQRIDNNKMANQAKSLIETDIAVIKQQLKQDAIDFKSAKKLIEQQIIDLKTQLKQLKRNTP